MFLYIVLDTCRQGLNDIPYRSAEQSIALSFKKTFQKVCLIPLKQKGNKITWKIQEV